MNAQNVSVVLFAGLLLVSTINLCDAAWLTGYNYRKEIEITGQAGAGTYYQVPFWVGQNASVSDCNFTLEDHGLANFNDTRWTGDDGSTELPYWLESLSSGRALFWVNVSANLNSSQSIYCYYGKAGDLNISDGQTTFIEFCQNNLTGFTVVNNESWVSTATPASDGTVTIVNGKISITMSDVDSRAVWLIGKTSTTETNISLEAFLFSSSGSHWPCIELVRQNDRGYGYFTLNFDTYRYINNKVETNIGNPNWAVNHILGLRRAREPRYYTYMDYVAVDGTTTQDMLSTNAAVFKIGYWNYNGGTAGTDVYNWVRIRKFIAPGPAFSSAGAEETPPPPPPPPFSYDTYRMTKTNTSVPPLDNDAADEFSDSLGGGEWRYNNFNFTQSMSALSLPYTSMLGNLFFLFLFGMPFLMAWIRQNNTAIPMVWGLVVGGSMLLFLPLEYRFTATLILVLAIVGGLWMVFKERF